MKVSTRIFVAAAGLLIVLSSSGFCELRMGPYYYLETSESAFIADGAFTLSTNIAGDFAAKVVFNDRWSMVPYYGLSYQGPGATSESKEGANFQEQYQEHAVIAKTVYNFSELWRLGGKAGYQVHLSKTGSTEEWTTGLYNNHGLTCGFDATTIIGDKQVDMGYLFTQCAYPNYSNLIGYFDKREARPEQDHYRHKFFVEGIKLMLKDAWVEGDFAYTIKAYAAQGVIGESGEENINVKQVDNISDLDIDVNYLPVKGLLFTLGQQVELNLSNQNDLSFGDPMDTTSLRFNSNYYGYTFYEVEPRVSYTFPGGICCMMSFAFNLKNYHARSPRNNEGGWLTGTEWDITREAEAGVSFPMEKFALGLYYTYVSSVSNMKYEGYYRYNYETHNIKLSYSFEY